MNIFGGVMIRSKWLYGWMVGVTIGFAVWGSAKPESARALQTQNAWVTEDGAETRIAAVVDAGTESDSAPASQSLHALSAVLMDGDSGRILYEKDGHTIRPMASTTKIMTCILALENGSGGDVCTMSKNAAAQPQVHLGAPAGSQFYLKDLLYSLMLESHNDTAVMVAEQIAGSAEAFAELMNQKARDIGCRDTFFITPNGLDAANTLPDGTVQTHGTTAADLARIMRYCIQESPQKEAFLTVTRTGNYQFTDVTGKRNYSCVNHNALLQMMDGALSGKTGFTGGAGYSYVGAWREGERTLIAALLGCGWPPHKTYKWSDVKQLFSYGQKHYFYRDVFQMPELPKLPVHHAVSQEPVSLSLMLPENQQHLNLLLKEEERLIQKLDIPDYLEAPVAEGKIVGSVSFLLDDTVVRTYPVYTEKTILRWDVSYCAKQIIKMYFL